MRSARDQHKRCGVMLPDSMSLLDTSGGFPAERKEETEEVGKETERIECDLAGGVLVGHGSYRLVCALLSESGVGDWPFRATAVGSPTVMWIRPGISKLVSELNATLFWACWASRAKSVIVTGTVKRRIQGLLFVERFASCDGRGRDRAGRSARKGRTPLFSFLTKSSDSTPRPRYAPPPLVHREREVTSKSGRHRTNQSGLSAGADYRGDAMTVQAKPLSEITRHAIDLLSKEMGIVDTVRFLNQFTTGYGDYTEEREALFKDLTLDEILAAMKKA